MILMESLTQLFESSSKDYNDLILKAAEALKKGKLWSPAAKKIAQDRAVMDKIGAVAGRFSKTQDERDDMVQDFFLKKFATIIRSAAKSIEAGDYTSKQFITLIGVAAANLFRTRHKQRETRSAGMEKARKELERAVDLKTKTNRGPSSANEMRTMLLRKLTDLVKKQKDEKSRKFLTAYFGLKGREIQFSGKVRDALKDAGMEVNSKNQVWASRVKSKAMSALKDDPMLRRLVSESEHGLLGALEENTDVSLVIFEEWLASLFEE